MKTVILSLVIGASLLVPSFAQLIPTKDRYRRIGDKIYDLGPFYDWIRTTQQDRLHYVEKPYKEWDWWTAVKVTQVTTNGLLLIEWQKYSLADAMYLPSYFFVTNFPGWSSRVDGDTVTFVAKHCGSVQFTDTLGGIRTVPYYDYGIPITPQIIKPVKPPAGTN